MPNKPMGRPKTLKERHTQQAILLTDRDIDWLREQAFEQKTTRSAIMRSLIDSERTKQNRRKEAPSLNRSRNND